MLVMFFIWSFHWHEVNLRNVQVQNEMLKRWKRWKLGKDIEEEYRNTHSQTAHGKGASVNMPLPPERSDTPESAASAPPAEESRHLVINCRNGARLAQGISRTGLQEGTSNSSSLTEDICLEERIHNTNHPIGTEECDVWGKFYLLRFLMVICFKKGIWTASGDRKMVHTGNIIPVLQREGWGFCWTYSVLFDPH